MRSKGVADGVETTTKVRAEEVEFTPASRSSGHVSIPRGDFAEFASDKILGRWLRENPAVVAAVVAAWEERQRAVELAWEEERLKAETERQRAEDEEFFRDIEVEETTFLERGVVRQVAVPKAQAFKCPTLVTETYAPSVPHLFFPQDSIAMCRRRRSTTPSS